MRLLRHCLRIAAAVCIAAAPCSLAAETFILTNGDVVEGTIVRAPAHMIEIKLAGSGLLRIPAASVQRVELETKDGEVVSGQLTDWSNGTYSLLTGNGPLQARVEQGVVVALTEGAGEDTGGQPADAAGSTATVAETAPAAAQSPSSDGSGIRAGFIYGSSVDDGGRTSMLENGRRRLSNNPLVDAATAIEVGTEDSVQMTQAVDQLVSDGANLVFMTGHDSAAVTSESAARHADVRFVQCGAFEPSSNIKVFCGRIYQARYLSGIVAGGMSETNLIGYVAARPTPETIVGINAFALGAQSINPDVDIIVHWTNAWYAPGTAQQRAEELIERGIDVLTLHQDSPAALQVAERRGVSAIGFQSDMSSFAPTSTLTSAIWNWGEMFDQVVDRLQEDNLISRPTWLGMREGVVDLTPIASHVPDDVKRLVQQRQREMIDGNFHVFTGPIRDVDGDVRILDGRIIIDEGLFTMDYLVQGVVGFQ